MRKAIQLTDRDIRFLSMLNDIRYSNEQLEEIRHAITAGVSYEDILRFFTKYHTPTQMQEMLQLILAIADVSSEKSEPSYRWPAA